MSTLIAAHRGGAILWPENSPTAFREAARLPVEQVEFDVHLSADGEVVVIHDATLDRTTEAQGAVAARTLTELRGIRLKGSAGETIPTLAEVAAILAPTALGPRMELKTGAGDARYPGLLPKSLTVLDAAGLLPRTTVTSFRLALAAEAMREPRLEGRAIWLVARGVVQDAGVTGAIAAARAAGVPMLGLHAADCDAAAVAACRAAGIRLGAWAVNDATTIARVLALGVEVFTTDDPVTALRLRAG